MVNSRIHFAKGSFPPPEHKFVYSRHIASSLELGSGEQGIVNGTFELTALCGVTDSRSQLDLFPMKMDGEVECQRCLDIAKQIEEAP